MSDVQAAPAFGAWSKDVRPILAGVVSLTGMSDRRLFADRVPIAVVAVAVVASDCFSPNDLSRLNSESMSLPVIFDLLVVSLSDDGISSVEFLVSFVPFCGDVS